MHACEHCGYCQWPKVYSTLLLPTLLFSIPSSYYRYWAFFPAQTRRQLLDKANQKGPQANKFTGRVRADLVTTWKLRYQKVSQGREGPSGDVMTIRCLYKHGIRRGRWNLQSPVFFCIAGPQLLLWEVIIEWKSWWCLKLKRKKSPKQHDHKNNQTFRPVFKRCPCFVLFLWTFLEGWSYCLNA